MKFFRLLFLAAAIVSLLSSATSISPAYAQCTLGSASYLAYVNVTAVQGHRYDQVFTGLTNTSIIYVEPTSGLTGFYNPFPGSTLTLIDLDCGTTAGTVTVTHFDPGDARLDPRPGDRLAVYCNSDNLAVWGIFSTSDGTQLVNPKLTTIMNAWKSFADGIGGTVWIGGHGSTFVIQWINVGVGANGKGDFVKQVSCPQG